MPLPSHNLTIVDYNGETSRTGINVGPVTAVTLPGLLTGIAAWRAAVAAVILGNQRSDSLTAYKSNLSAFLPTDPNAQVERKWKLTYVDTTEFFDVLEAIPNQGYGKFFEIEIATANAELLEDNQEFLDLNDGAGADLVTAFEAIAKSPYGGVPNVYSIELVGRTR